MSSKPSSDPCKTTGYYQQLTRPIFRCACPHLLVVVRALGLASETTIVEGLHDPAVFPSIDVQREGYEQRVLGTALHTRPTRWILRLRGKSSKRHGSNEPAWNSSTNASASTSAATKCKYCRPSSWQISMGAIAIRISPSLRLSFPRHIPTLRSRR